MCTSAVWQSGSVVQSAAPMARCRLMASEPSEGSGTAAMASRYSRDRLWAASAWMSPSGERRKTAARSAPKSSIVCSTSSDITALSSSLVLSSMPMRATASVLAAWPSTRCWRLVWRTASASTLPTAESRSRSKRPSERPSALSTTMTPQASAPLPMGAKTCTLSSLRPVGLTAMGRPSRMQTAAMPWSTASHHARARCGPSVRRGARRVPWRSAKAIIPKRPVSRRRRAAARSVASRSPWRRCWLPSAASSARPEPVAASSVGRAVGWSSLSPPRADREPCGAPRCPAAAVSCTLTSPAAGRPQAALEGHHGGLQPGHVEEALEVRHAIPAITPLVDAQATQPTLIGPRPHGVGVDAEEPGGPRHGDGGGLLPRFDGTGPPED